MSKNVSNMVKINLSKLARNTGHPFILSAVKFYSSFCKDEDVVQDLDWETYKELYSIFHERVEDCVIGEIPNLENYRKVFYTVNVDKFVKTLISNRIDPIRLFAYAGINAKDTSSFLSSKEYDLYLEHFNDLSKTTGIDFSDCVVDKGIEDEDDFDYDDNALVCYKQINCEDCDEYDDCYAVEDEQSVEESDVEKYLDEIERLKEEIKMLKNINYKLEKDSIRLVKENAKLSDSLNVIKSKLSFIQSLIDKELK